MAENGLETRKTCPACLFDRAECVIREPFREMDPSYWEEFSGIRDLRGEMFEIVRCSSCGLYYQRQIPNPASMEHMLSRFVRSLPKRAGGKVEFYEGYARQVASISKVLQKKPCDLEILDYGSGWGFWCLMARAFSYPAMGYDVNRVRVDHMRQMGLAACDDREELRDRRFDFINAEQVLEHVADVKGTLEWLAGRLKPGGALRVAVPNCQAAGYRISGSAQKILRRQITPFEHLNGFTVAALASAARRAGLQAFPVSRRSMVHWQGRAAVKQWLGIFLPLRYDLTMYFGKSTR